MGLLRAIIRITPLGPTIILYDLLTGDEVNQGPIDNMKDWAEEQGDQIVDTIVEGAGDIADAISGFGSDLGSGLLSLVRGAGIAVIEGMEDVYGYIAVKVGGKKVQITSSVTILGIIMFTTFYILRRLPSGEGDSA